MPFESTGAKYEYIQYSHLHIKTFIQYTMIYHTQTLTSPLAICQQKVPVPHWYGIIQLCSSYDGFELPGIYTLQFYCMLKFEKAKTSHGHVSNRNNIFFMIR